MRIGKINSKCHLRLKIYYWKHFYDIHFSSIYINLLSLLYHLPNSLHTHSEEWKSSWSLSNYFYAFFKNTQSSNVLAIPCRNLCPCSHWIFYWPTPSLFINIFWSYINNSFDNSRRVQLHSIRRIKHSSLLYQVFAFETFDTRKYNLVFHPS